MSIQETLGNETCRLQSIVEDASTLSSPTMVQTILKAKPEIRALMVDTAAKLAIFSAENISRAVGRHAQGVSDEDARKYISETEEKSEELSLNDGRIIALIDDVGDVFRYRMEKVIFSKLSSNDHLGAYHACIKEMPHLRLDSVEQEVFLGILRRAHSLAHFSKTVVDIPSLRNLQKVKEALETKHTAVEVFSIDNRIPIDYMEDAWELEHANV